MASHKRGIRFTFYDKEDTVYHYLCQKIRIYDMSRPMYNERTSEREPGTNSMRGYDHTRFNNDIVYTQMVQTAARYYDDLRTLRKKVKRDDDYCMGRQLNDTVVYNGHAMTVHDYMELKGMTPLSNDIITDKMVTMKGLYRNQYMAPKVKSVDAQEGDFAMIISELLRQNDNINEKAEHMADQLEEHLSGGFICSKVKWAFRYGREDVYVDIVDLVDLAFPVFRRKDLEDVDFIAEAHDMTWAQVLQAFCHKPSDEEKLQQIYTAAAQNNYVRGYKDTGMDQSEHNDDFYHSRVIGKYRVIEVWRKEYNRALWCHDRLNATAGFRELSDKAAIEAENRQRLEDNIIRDEYGVPVLDADGNQTYYVPQDEVQLIEYEPRIEEMWYYRFLSPNGYLLSEGISPYRVVRDGYSFYYHPYVFLAYGKKGEVRSFVDRIIDKQRQFNHDNILIDFIIMNSSKGVMAVDTNALSDEMNWQEMAEQWVKVDGVVLYTSKNGGNIPQQVQNKSLPAGLELIMQRDREMLQTQSNVQPALQGATPTAGTSFKRYAAEQQSSATGVADYVASFNNFARRVAKKQVWTMQAFYDSRRSVQITGEDFWRYYDPQTMGDLECDLAMTLDTNSAVIRENLQELAYQFYLRDEIASDQMLDAADFGDTAKMKRMILEHRQYKAQVAQQQAAMGMAPTGMTPGVQERGNGSSRLNDGQNDAVPSVVGSPGTSS